MSIHVFKNLAFLDDATLLIFALITFEMLIFMHSLWTVKELLM